MNILEELWYGNINPNEQAIRRSSTYGEALHKASTEKKLVLAHFSPEMQSAIEQMIDAQLDAAAITEQEAFIAGFRLAVQIMVDGLRTHT